MNRLFRKFLFLYVLVFFHAKAICNTADLQGRVGGFFPQSKTFREVYGSVKPSYQIEATLLFKKHVGLWSNFSYLTAKGKSDPLCISTTLHVLSLSGGWKYVVFLPRNFQVRLGAGPVYSWLNEKNKACFCRRVKKDNGIGGIVKLEVTKTFGHFILSFFTDYQHQKFKPKNSSEDRKVNFSGFYVGGAIGYSFGL